MINVVIDWIHLYVNTPRGEAESTLIGCSVLIQSILTGVTIERQYLLWKGPFVPRPFLWSTKRCFCVLCSSMHFIFLRTGKLNGSIQE